MPTSWTNQLYFGDNLSVLREHIHDESIDLIYLDPPFNSHATYNVLFRAPTGEQSQAQLEAFEDTWHWNETAERAFDEVVHSGNTDAAEMLRALRTFLKENDMMAYLTMMAVRLLELHRVLKSTGSIYLHCDPTASHYLKIVMDAIFRKESFRNEISWRRSQTRSSISKIYRRAHDIMLFYAKSDEYNFNVQYRALSEASKKLYSNQDERGTYQAVPLLVSGRRNGETGKTWRGIDPNTRGKTGMHWVTVPNKLEEYDKEGLVVWPQKVGGVPRLKYYIDESPGVPLNDFWSDIDLLSASATEALGYPTQKPLELLERIVNGSSNPDEIILDPFCGCGTAIHAAQKLARHWIGIDITHLAISLIEKRLKDAFTGIQYEVHGTPKDLDGAKALADRDKYQFQWWAVSLVNAVPYGGKKKGADTGIDGLIYFKPDGKTTEKVIVSVKGGENVSAPMIRDLGHVIDREQAKVGVFITLTAPTRPMQTEAVKAGFYTSPYHGDVPKIQILTIEDLFAGKKPQIPFLDPSTFRRAPHENRERQKQLFE